MALRIKAPAIAALAVLLVSSPVLAGDAGTALAWSTYLRSGPGETYAAIDELSHDVHVRVIGCDARWCRVADGTTQGYVDRDALALPHPPPADALATTGCVVVGQADNRKPIPTRFCSPPAARGAPQG